MAGFTMALGSSKLDSVRRMAASLPLEINNLNKVPFSCYPVAEYEIKNQLFHLCSLVIHNQGVLWNTGPSFKTQGFLFHLCSLVIHKLVTDSSAYGIPQNETKRNKKL